MLRWLLRTVLNLALCAVLALVILFGGSYIYKAVTGSDFGGAKADARTASANTAVPESPTPVAQGMKVSLEIDQDQGASILQSAVSQVLTLNNVNLSLRADGTAGLTGDIDKKSLKSALSAKTELPELIISAIDLLPDGITVSIELESAGAENGQVKLQPASFGVGGISIGAQYLPDGAMDAINDRLTEYAAQSGVYVTDIAITEGLIRLSGNLENVAFD